MGGTNGVLLLTPSESMGELAWIVTYCVWERRKKQEQVDVIGQNNGLLRHFQFLNSAFLFFSYMIFARCGLQALWER